MIFLLECVSVRPGLISGELDVSVKTSKDRKEFLRVAQGGIYEVDGAKRIEVGFIRSVGEDYLVELPMEADSGAHRIWVPKSSISSTVAETA